MEKNSSMIDLHIMRKYMKVYDGGIQLHFILSQINIVTQLMLRFSTAGTQVFSATITIQFSNEPHHSVQVTVGSGYVAIGYERTF